MWSSNHFFWILLPCKQYLVRNATCRPLIGQLNCNSATSYWHVSSATSYYCVTSATCHPLIGQPSLPFWSSYWRVSQFCRRIPAINTSYQWLVGGAAATWQPPNGQPPDDVSMRDPHSSNSPRGAHCHVSTPKWSTWQPRQQVNDQPWIGSGPALDRVGLGRVR